MHKHLKFIDGYESPHFVETSIDVIFSKTGINNARNKNRILNPAGRPKSTYLGHFSKF